MQILGTYPWVLLPAFLQEPPLQPSPAHGFLMLQFAKLMELLEGPNEQRLKSAQAASSI